MTAPTAFDPVRHRRGGRRPKPAADRQECVLSLRLTVAKMAEAEARAQAAGLSVADFGRAALDGAPVRVTVSQTAAPEVLRHLRIMGGNVRQALEEIRRSGLSHLAAEAALIEAAQTISAELRRLLHGPEC